MELWINTFSSCQREKASKHKRALIRAMKGVKVKIAGRLAGKEIARAECIKKGRLPLQTIRSKIDYCCYPIRTIYGVLGVKIWIFVDEE
ncbi:hypothetical protein DAI22_05g156200 [Oryza sativa Japonica Group]|nr:hypothetical protein DAI22_05g156200 [Oryza sativa Japonica Group]